MGALLSRVINGSLGHHTGKGGAGSVRDKLQTDLLLKLNDSKKNKKKNVDKLRGCQIFDAWTD